MVGIAIQKIILKKELDGILVPKQNYFLGEIKLKKMDRLPKLTGYHGDSGLVFITKTKKYLFVSGRDELQAKIEAKGCEVIAGSFKAFLEKQKKRLKVGYNPFLHTKPVIDAWAGHADMVEVREKMPAVSGKYYRFPEKYAGKSRKTKITEIVKKMAGDYLLITDPTDLSWLLNWRGHDMKCLPAFIAFGLLSKKGKIEIYKHPVKLVKRLRKIKGTIEADKKTLTAGFYDGIKNLMDRPSIIDEAKSIKNAVEIKNIKDTCIEEGRAVASVLSDITEGWTESRIVKELQKERKKIKAYREDSFETIAAVDSHAAMPHYAVTKKTNAVVKPNSIVLIDTGGQYVTGTMDTTRTICIGTPAKEQIRDSTLVLKGHIALAETVFPKGKTKDDLEHIARKFLQAEGKDYPHSTSHGIGYYLGVHETPLSGQKIPLQAGMVISIEPGFYVEGKYGIRHENMALVVPVGTDRLGFNILTYIPFDEKLIDEKMLTPKEKAWLNEYQTKAKKLCRK